MTISINESTTNKVTVASATAMTAVDATNQPGLYYYDYTVTSTFFGTIVAQATTTDTTCVVRSLEMLYISVPWLPPTASGTASAGASATITLAGASATDSLYNGQTVMILAGTGAGQTRLITAYVGSTKVATVTPAWVTNPDSTSVFSTVPTGANVAAFGLTAVTGRDIGANVLLSSGTGTGQLDFTSGVVKANFVQILGTAIAGTAALLAAAITKFFNVASPTGTVNSLPDAVPGANTGLPVLDSNLRVSANVTAMASGVIAAATFAANALDAVWSTTARTLSAGAITASTFAANALDAVWSTAARTLTAFGFSVTVGTNSDKTGYALSAAGVQAVWDALTSALTTVGSIGKRIADFLTGDSFVRLGAPAGASVSADIAEIAADADAILAKTALIGTATNLTVISPVISSSKLVIVPGDAYYNADGRAIYIAPTSAPSLVGGSIVLRIGNPLSPSLVSAAGVITGVGTYYIELAVTDSVKLSGLDALDFSIIATLVTSAHPVTIAQGKVATSANVGA